MPPEFNDVAVSRAHRFALGVDDSGNHYLSIPVGNRLVDYCEYYRIDRAAFDRYRADPEQALRFVERCRNREVDGLLIIPPGRDRGTPG